MLVKWGDIGSNLFPTTTMIFRWSLRWTCMAWHQNEGLFLEAPYCYLFMLNVDWFQRFTQYLDGAMYLTVKKTYLCLNLTKRKMSFWLAYFLAMQSLHSLLSPFLHHLCRSSIKLGILGLNVKTSSNTEITIHLALTCVTCDLQVPVSKRCVVFWVIIPCMDAIRATKSFVHLGSAWF